MANLDKARMRIEQFYQGELSQHEPTVRAALGRRLEVDARFRAIENYLEELTYDVSRNTVSPGLEPASAAVTTVTLEPAPGNSSPEQERKGPGEDLLAVRAELRRQYYAERIDEYDAAEYVSGGPVQRQGFPTHERVQEWRRADAACRAKERAAGLLVGSRPPCADWCDGCRKERHGLTAPHTPREIAPQTKSLQEQVYALQERLSECDEDDSRRLRLMCDVIDDKIGWDDEEQQEAGDYLARLKQIAEELPELREAERRVMHADSNVKQARAVRDKALAVIEAARPLEITDRSDSQLMAAALERVAKAVKEYDW
jgi:hypothetical protein